VVRSDHGCDRHHRRPSRACGRTERPTRLGRRRFRVVRHSVAEKLLFVAQLIVAQLIVKQMV
jgi:hypothetical protein